MFLVIRGLVYYRADELKDQLLRRLVALDDFRGASNAEGEDKRWLKSVRVNGMDYEIVDSMLWSLLE